MDYFSIMQGITGQYLETFNNPRCIGCDEPISNSEWNMNDVTFMGQKYLDTADRFIDQYKHKDCLHDHCTSM